MAESPVVPTLTAQLRSQTQARTGLARTGQSLTTTALLEFELAHARARDAVHARLDTDGLRNALTGRHLIEVQSRAGDRATYLQRPDLGRMLAEDAPKRLFFSGAELAIVIGDGLSATAVAQHAARLVDILIKCLTDWSVAPIVLANQARVALGDEIGAALGVDLVVMLIGERPGLSASDSLGAYVTWAPQKGRRDSERECVSNIRPPHGLSYVAASEQITRILNTAREMRSTGICLNKERSRSRPGQLLR